MANKIVQLKDKTYTDNIYPIAGGMAANSITTQMLQDNSVTSDKTGFTVSNVSLTIAGKAVTGKKLDLGNGVVIVGCHATLTGMTTTSDNTSVQFSGIPSMQVISCGVEAMQIGQATSYASYQHFYASGTGGNFYIRNTTSGSNNSLEINLHAIGVLNPS